MSNRRRIRRFCAMRGCYDEATVVGHRFDDDGVARGTVAWCDRHAVEGVRLYGGKVWADKQCTCGRIHDIINRAGRRAEGSV